MLFPITMLQSGCLLTCFSLLTPLSCFPANVPSKHITHCKYEDVIEDLLSKSLALKVLLWLWYEQLSVHKPKQNKQAFA